MSGMQEVDRYFFEGGDGRAYGWPIVAYVAFANGLGLSSVILLIFDACVLLAVPTLCVALLRRCDKHWQVRRLNPSLNKQSDGS
jgi:hypothetical protein